MNLTRQILPAGLTVASLFLAMPVPAAKTSAKDARVTQIIREVKLLPAEAEARAAAINDRVAEDTAVRTGEQSRSELTFADLTITRLGANSVYSYNKSGRAVDLRGGSILLRVPKDSGGANINAQAVSVAVTGTTLILETSRGGRSKLIVLEGVSRLTLLKNSAQRRVVQAGQMLDVPAGATTLPEPVNIDLNQLMKTHPLITGFPPLPSQNLITAAANRPRGDPTNETVYQGQPAGSGPRITTGGIGLPGLPFPTGGFGGSSGGNVKNPGGGRGNAGSTSGNASTPGNQNNPTNNPKSSAASAGARQVSKASRVPQRTPTPTPIR